MPTKITAKKEEAKKETEDKKVQDKGKYFYAVGRRKTSIARVKLFLTKSNQITVNVNGKKVEEYFPTGQLRDLLKAPLAMSGEAKFEVETKVIGGGTSSQAEAVRLGIARALVVFNPELKKSLKDVGYLTRDSRKVERKKPGLKKARRAPQWAKR